ncbi:MAG: type II toxin-antitoxin system CcdA family antitoxin [Rhodoferax sp.]|nr:type II toxin-antitoxin system CcdA family antitoxin [Rhodoferax sp.]
MKLGTSNSKAPKRPVNLTLSEKNVEEARHYTTNLSATVDELLAEFVARETLLHNEQRQHYAKVSAAWNKFEEMHGSFADEHSTL